MESSRLVTATTRYAKNATIVLIGMRGVGKTTLAGIASKALGWEAIDADAVFSALVKQDIYSYVNANGWEAFRTKESHILATLLIRYPTNKVIACGGGVVERPENREILKAFAESHGPVIHVLREKDIVLRYLEENTSLFPAYLRTTAAEAWDRRESFYRECSSHEFVSLSVTHPPHSPPSTPSSDSVSLLLKPVERSFLRLLRFMHGIDTNHAVVGPGAPRTYFLALTFPDVTAAVPIIDEISIGVDCWELRVDLLVSQNPTFVAFQIATLRRYSDLPILFTVRTRAQGGKFPDLDNDDDRARMYNLIIHAYKMGCEYVDLELAMSDNILASLIELRGHTKVIGSLHDWSGSISWTGQETMDIYERAVRLGVDIVKLVNTAKRFEDNLSLRTFADQVAPRGVPLLAINMGPEGKMSRILNPVLSPISHPLLPNPSAPGQISFAESQQILYLTGLLPVRNFYLFGSPIAHSLSPVLHRASFKALSLPHTFTPVSVSSITAPAFKEIIAQPDFGGAAITIPLKINALSLCRRVSHHARLIGAINTLIPTQGGVLVGENTDWRAIQTCVARCITPANAVTAHTTALVIGAGGTARAALYALHQLGVANIWLFNRTRANAAALAEEMMARLDAFLKIRVLDDIDAGSVRRAVEPLPMPSIIISTIPASRAPAAAVGNENEEYHGVGIIPDVGLRREVLELSTAGGVAVELAYQPRITPLLKLVDIVNSSGRAGSAVKVEDTDASMASTVVPPLNPRSLSSSSSPSLPPALHQPLLFVPWVAVEGVEILLEQGYEQCRLWTTRRAPQLKIREAVLTEFERHVQQGLA